MKNKGLSPMVATIILIAMVMIIAGILAAGITGKSPDKVRQPGIELEGVTENSTSITIHKLGGKMLTNAYNILDNNGTQGNDNIKWNKMELRVAGVAVSADIIKATSDGVKKYAGSSINNTSGSVNWENDINMHSGDILKLENIQPLMTGGDEVRIVWTPTNQLLYNIEV